MEKYVHRIVMPNLSFKLLTPNRCTWKLTALVWITSQPLRQLSEIPLKSLIVDPVYLLSLQASSISFMASCNTSNGHHNQAPSSITTSCFLPMTNEPNYTVKYEIIYGDCILAWQMCHQSYIGTILYQITATLILASDYGHQLYDRVSFKNGSSDVQDRKMKQEGR